MLKLYNVLVGEVMQERYHFFYYLKFIMIAVDEFFPYENFTLVVVSLFEFPKWKELIHFYNNTITIYFDFGHKWSNNSNKHKQANEQYYFLNDKIELSRARIFAYISIL